MSTGRGNGSRTRAQKHKNHFAFKNDLHDKTPTQNKINSLHVSEVCQRCKHVIEWKIKYKKYKPLSQPSTCVRCKQKNVKKAYHVICRDCAKKDHVCAKCMKSAHEVEIEPAKPTEEEQIKLKVEMDRLVKSFPERKRRSFLRYMAKGKQIEESEEPEKENNQEVQVKPKRIPHSREDLIKKIEELQIQEEDEFDLSDFSDEKSDDEEEETEDEQKD